MVYLFKEIIQNNPPLSYLHLSFYHPSFKSNDSEGEIILETLLNSSITTIKDFILPNNLFWFKNGDIEREGSVEMLTEVISNQTSSL